MPMSHALNNVRAAALRAEFQNESGEVAMSGFIKGSSNTDGTRVAHTASTAKMSTGELPYATSGVAYNTLTTTYSSSSSPAKTVPKTSLSNVSYGDYRGAANVPFAGTDNFNTSTQIIGDDSNTSSTKFHQGVGAFKPGQAIQTYQSGMGTGDTNSNLPKYAMRHGQKSNNSNNYVDLLTHAAPGDIMWSAAVTSTGQQPYSPTNGTMNPAWSTSSQNTSATSILSYGVELFDGADRWTIVHAKICKGGERYCYHRLNYGSTGQNYNMMAGLVRSPSSSTAASGRLATASSFASSDYENKTMTMGTIYGQGEIMIFMDLTPFAATVLNVTGSGAQHHTTRYYGSTSGGGTKYSVAMGQYQEGTTPDFKAGFTPSSSRGLTIRGSGGHTGSGENSMVLLRILP